MLYRFLSDLLVIIHLVFILFVLIGGLLILKYKKLIWLHIPAVIWGVIVEFFDRFCPLTPMENYFRSLAGMESYQGDFIERYLLVVMYPDELTRKMQILFAIIVISLNVLIYSYLIISAYRKKKQFDG